MSFIQLSGIDDIQEQKPAPEGSYDLCIVTAKMNEKEGKQSIMTMLEIEGEPDFANVFHYVALPGPSDEPEKAKAKLLFAKRFFHQFGITVDGGVEMEQIVGNRATGAKLIQEEYEGNVTNKLQVNRLPTEEVVESVGAAG